MKKSFPVTTYRPRPRGGAPVDVNAKDPWLAVNLSMFFPGLGQLYAGNARRGLALAIAQVALAMVAIWSVFSPEGQTMWIFGLIPALVTVYVVGIVDARRSVYLARADSALEKIPRRQKNPWFAVFVSRIIPGLGHLYGNRTIPGLLFLTVSLFCMSLEDFFASLLFVSPAIASIATYHTYLSFPHRHHPRRYTYRSLVALMVGVIFAWGIFCNYFPDWLTRKIEVFRIPSESMVPTLEVGDRVMVGRSDRYRPKRGDVVVFHPPETVKKIVPDAGDFFIKRVIGVAGDKIQVYKGRVYLNDRLLEKDYTPATADYELYPIVVPPNRVFVLGDNRAHSMDSHLWGFLPEDLVLGPAYKICWPPDRVRSLLE